MSDGSKRHVRLMSPQVCDTAIANTRVGEKVVLGSFDVAGEANIAAINAAGRFIGFVRRDEPLLSQLLAGASYSACVGKIVRDYYKPEANGVVLEVNIADEVLETPFGDFGITITGPARREKISRPTPSPQGWGNYRLCLSPSETFVAIDFETTGFSAASDEIIELAAIRVRPGETSVDHLHRLVRASRPLPPHIKRITGITDAEIESGGVDRCDAIGELVAFIGDDAIVAYNASFDLSFLRAACAHHGLKAGAGRHSCALALARQCWPALASHKLRHVADRLGLSGTGEHRALADAQRAANVYRAATIEHLGLHEHVSPEIADILRSMHFGA